MKARSLITGMAALAALNVQAADVEISVQNLTQGIYFTPLLVVAHDTDTTLFTSGTAASPELQAMAEGGSIDGLMTAAMAAGADIQANPAGGLLGPTQSTTTTLMTQDSNTRLSIVAMMLPTNDGFIGLDDWTIPTEAGTYTILVNAYDAGTEANDEVRGSGMPGQAGFPVPPPLEALIGMNGTGVTAEVGNDYVHIHPGNIGDDEPEAGKSDVNNAVQRWLNPVARVTVTVSE